MACLLVLASQTRAAFLQIVPFGLRHHARRDLAEVDAVAAFLRGAGVEHVADDPVALHESALWNLRETGSTDVLISAANEFNVRYHIEMGFHRSRSTPTGQLTP